MRLLAPLLLLLVVGCRPGKVGNAAGDLTLGSQTVQFPRTFVGHPTTAQLELRNGSKASRVVRLKTQAPFGVEAESVELPGGASVLAKLTFDPQAAGTVEGVLTVESEGTTLQATLVGPAELEPDCTSTVPCWVGRFDAESGQCLSSKADDGSACSAGVCLVGDSKCIDGQCIGLAKDCDDHDACTTDACEPATGCIHFSATARCGSSTDPCKVPACDPLEGCTFVDAADGTSCGPADCSRADICLLGVCKNVPVGDGAACGTPSPCQALGLCMAQACVRPPAEELAPAWTVWVPADRRLIWDSIADRFGNVYWREAEADYQSGHLVSVTSAGFKRFSRPIPGASQMALIEDLLILRFGGKLEARRIGDGTLAWTREILPASDGGGSISIRTLARGTAGVVYVGFMRLGVQTTAGSQPLIGSALAALRLTDGTTLWEVPFPGQRIEEPATPVDESGYVYAGTVDNSNVRRYFGISPKGQLRWGVQNPHSSPASVFGGRVYHWDHWLSETATGTWVNTSPPSLLGVGFPRLALGAVNYVGSNDDAGVPDCNSPVSGAMKTGTAFNLVRVDPPTSQVRWSLEIAGADGGGLSMTNTVLTSRSTILFSQSEDYCNTTQRHVLREVGAQGKPTFTCRLPGTESYWGEGLLNAGRWVSAVRERDGSLEGVRAIPLAGFELPQHGWATAWGSPARDNHAR